MIKITTAVRNKLVEIKRSIGLFIIKTYEGTEKKATVLNNIQLSEGKNSDGSDIGQYAELTKSLREAKGLQTDFVDLDFTGARQRNMKFKTIVEEYAEISSDVPYITDITNRYGTNPFGLTEENTKKYSVSWFKEFSFLIKRLWQR